MRRLNKPRLVICGLDVTALEIISKNTALLVIWIPVEEADRLAGCIHSFHLLIRVWRTSVGKRVVKRASWCIMLKLKNSAKDRTKVSLDTRRTAECEGSLQATLTRTSGSSFGDARGSFGGAKLIFLGEIVLPRKRFANGEMLLEYEGFNFGRGES